MAVELRGAEDFARFGAALKESGDKELRKQVGKALREQAKPLGQLVVREGAQAMPKRGGFAALVAEAKVGMRFSMSKNPTAVLLLSDKSNHDLKSLDEGKLRHPVFLRSRHGLLRRKTARGKTGHVLGGEDRKAWTWVAQRVPAGEFTRAFEAHAQEVAEHAVKAVQAVLDDAARKA